MTISFRPIHRKSPTKSEADRGYAKVKVLTKTDQIEGLIHKHRCTTIVICAVFILAAIIFATVIGSKISEIKGESQRNSIETSTWVRESDKSQSFANYSF